MTWNGGLPSPRRASARGPVTVNPVATSFVWFCCAFVKTAPGFPSLQAGARLLRARPAAAVGGERLIGPRPASQRSSSRHPSVHAHAPTATPARALLPRMKLNVQLTLNVGRSAGLTPRRKSTYSVRLPQNLKTNKWPTADRKPRRSHEQPSHARGSGLRVRAVLSQ